MKRIFCIILILCINFLASCTNASIPEPQNEKVDTEIRAVWIYYDELSMISENGGTAETFTAKMSKIIETCVNNNINTLFMQVRPFCDAFYNSSIFPTSYYLTGEQGKGIEYDPLKITIELAHNKNITVHAWLNPFRIMYNFKKFTISKNNPCYDWIYNKSNNIITTDEGIFMCPASSDVQKLVLDGVREIVENYDIDGIHIDDYFYPTTDESADSTFYKEYKEKGGTLSLKNWRTENISSLVTSMYNVVKSKSQDCIFSISPQGNNNNNINQQFADCCLWLSNYGYADWIIPQIYYSFDNKTLPFDKCADEWNTAANGKVKLIFGLALYKVGTDFDEYEIEKQMEYIKKLSHYGGYAMFSYSSIS